VNRPPASLPPSKKADQRVGVSLSHLSKSFGSFEVLKDVSFSVEPGEVFVLMGPSGSGKSVLLRHIVGLERPTSGQVTVGGLDAADEHTRERIRMAMVFQAGALFNSLSVFDNLALYPREHRVGSERDIREKVMHALRILSLEDAAGKMPADLSGGMKKRVAIARALVTEPQLILYDEPTSELDPVMAATISEIIASVKQQAQITTIVVSHDRDLALSIPDRVGILMDGELISLGPPSALRQPSDARIADFLNPRIDVRSPRFKKLETNP
jgi:phospholipid/cholesterol/gamma-HCH transport system ATP-binding protein